jgi:peptide/nickel transport system permease protein
VRRFNLAVGGGLLGLFGLTALLAPFLSPYAPGLHDLSAQLAAPSAAHLLGRNQNGEDLLTIVIHGSRVSLIVGCLTVAVSLVAGTLAGLAAGFFGGWPDRIVSRTVDVVLAFPGILLAIAISAVLGPSVRNVVLSLTAAGWVPFARLARGEALSLREREYVSAARSLGASAPRILSRHLLPNMAPPLIVQASFSMAAAILAESSLSFLGLGVPVGTQSWGKAVADGARYLLQAPHLATFPGLAIMLSVLALNFLGDGLRDKLHAR